MEKNVVVTAANSQYHRSLLTLISGLHKYGIDFLSKIYVYNLGLDIEEINQLNKLYLVEVLDFPEELKSIHPNFLTPKSHVYKLYCLYNNDFDFDNLLWLDAGVTPIKNMGGMFELINKDEVFMVVDTHLNRTYTHSKCVEIMSATNEELDKKMLSSGIIGYKKNGKYQKLFEEAFNYSMIEGCVDGDQENHRHDQSVLSILSVRYNCPLQDIDIYGYWTDINRNLQTAIEKNAVIFVHRRGYDNTNDLIYSNQVQSHNGEQKITQKSRIKFVDENLVGQEGLSRYISPNTNWNKDFETEDYDIAIYTDKFCYIKEPDSTKTNYAWLIEPPIINGTHYIEIEKVYTNFKKVFSYNKSLSEKINNFEFIPHGGTWARQEDISLHEKSKNISFIYSDKTWNLGHRLRHNFVNFLKEKSYEIDYYGSGSEKPIQFKIEGLKDYRFSIVMENSVLDDYFTEKILDCFLTGTIPLYWGTKNIVNYFDENGVVFLPSSNEWGFDFDKSLEIISNLNEEFYLERLDSVIKNFNKAQEYIHPENFITKIIS